MKKKRPLPRRILAEERKIEAEERKIERMGQQELAELQKLEKDVRGYASHPLTRITYHDLIRGSIGAVFGTVGHFAFFYGVEIAEKISAGRATFLYLLSLLICFLFMYYSGFRKVREVKVKRFIPLRVIVIYSVALAVVALTLFAFGFIDTHSSFVEVYKTVATNSLLAVLGASTADILGKD